jgi:Tol biopolymer transport system component
MAACAPSIDVPSFEEPDEPLAVIDQYFTTAQNVAVTIDGLAGVLGPVSHSLIVLSPTAPMGQTVEVTDGRHIVVTPRANFSGDFQVDWTIGGVSQPATAHATVTVTRSDDPVMAVSASIEVTGPTAVTIGSIGGGIDPLSYAIVSAPQNGSLGTLQDDTVTYTPNVGFVGTDSFTFQVKDDFEFLEQPSVATITLDVHGGITPAAIDGKISVAENGSTSLTLQGSGGSGPLTYHIEQGPASGTLTGDSTSAIRFYTPNPGFAGFDQLTFSVSDGTHRSNIATVSIDVEHVNHVPVAIPQSLQATEDIALVITLGGTDEDGDPLGFIVFAGPQHGSLDLSGSRRIYRPFANFHGHDEFQFLAADSQSSSQPATISIEVTSVDDPPVVQDLAKSLSEDGSVAITLTAGDADGDPITLAYGQPSNGTVTGTPPNVVYTPAPDFNGPDSFTYTATANGVTSPAATVSLTVLSVDDPPIASDAEVTTPEDKAIAIALHATDVDGPALTFSVLAAPSDGSVTITGNIATFTPKLDSNGTRSFTFRAFDGSLFSTAATVTIHITAVNDPPVARDDYAAAAPATPLTIDALANDSDVDGEAVAFDPDPAALEPPAHGTAAIVDGKIVYTPDAGFTDIDTFSYAIVDPSGATATARIHVGVGAFPPGAPVETVAGTGTSGQGSDMPALSADGRIVVFTSALALVDGDTNNAPDIYVYDRNTRQFSRASIAGDGSQANGESGAPHVSADGRYVVFDSAATNLVGADTNGQTDVFRHDRLTGETLRISVATGGGQVTGISVNPSISDDGNLIAFASTAFDLVPGDANGASDVFVRNLAAGTTTRVSANFTGGDADLGSFVPAISGDGRFVAFESSATNLVPGDGNGARDVFVRDLAAATTTRVSVSSTGTEGNGGSSRPAISRDGRFVAFLSSATNLVLPATAGGVYVRDLAGPTTTRSATSAGQSVQLSGDGRYLVTFTSSSATLVDRFAPTSVALPGASNGEWPAISANGRYVASIGLPGSNVIIAPNPL